MDNEAFHTFLGVYSFFLFVFGVVFNLLTFFICLSKRLRVTPTFVLIAFMAILDALSLCFWNIDHFLHQFFNYIQEDLSLEACKIVTFLQCFSSQSSSWLLVAMGIERYLSVQIRKWRISVINTKKAVSLGIFIILIISLINMHLFFTLDYDYYINATILGECVTGDTYNMWMRAHIYLYSLVPFVILIISNLLLVYCVFVRRDNAVAPVVTTASNSRTKKKSLSLTIIVLATTFLILSAPKTIIRGYFLIGFSEHPSGISIIFLTDGLAFTFHSLNFIIFYFTNKCFSFEVRTKVKLLKSLTTNHTSNVTTINTRH